MGKFKKWFGSCLGSKQVQDVAEATETFTDALIHGLASGLTEIAEDLVHAGAKVTFADATARAAFEKSISDLVNDYVGKGAAKLDEIVDPVAGVHHLAGVTADAE